MNSTVLLCPPVFFDVTYSINPWMKATIVNKPVAMDQWFKMKNTLEFLGATTKLIGQERRLPDMVFTANAGTVHGQKVVMSNFRHFQRKPEREIFQSWFEENGYETYILPEETFFEGCGDAIVSGDRLIGGYGFRSDLRALRLAADILDLKLTSLKLKNPNFYHLDTCFSLLRDDFAIYYPGAFSKHTISKVKDIELLPVSEEEANRFACNSIIFGDNVLMPYGNDTLANILEELGFQVHLIDTSEFLKSGGSLQCMALWI
ncbi:MAG TPA: amidinotransferase [Flavobacteriales bacterium]|nr:amidinotransferase [Flavobacteriales bacterium]